MPPPSFRYNGKLVWYPGILFGRPPPELDWSTGQGLGIRGRAADGMPDEAGDELVWTTTERLLTDLEDTEHLVGVISVLELCLTVLTEPVELLLAALRALTRLCWGFQDRVVYAVKCGVCEHVSKVLHWHWNTGMHEVILATLHVIIMLADHGGREVRSLLGSLGVPGLLTAALKWHRLHSQNNGGIVEFACKALYQLSLGPSENRTLLRRAGADKELYCLWRYPHFLPRLQQQSVKDQAMQVLTLMKDQLLSDLGESNDCWFVFSSVKMSVASMRHYDPQQPEEGKGEDLVQTGLHALLRLLLSSDGPAVDDVVKWNKTTQLTLFGVCELLVEVLRNFGHFRSCSTTACKVIATMLQDSSSKSSLRVKQRFGASWADDMRRPVEGANSSALRLQDPANVSTTLDEGQGGTGDSALEGVDSAVSGPDTLPNIISCDEETDDVEMDVLRDIIEEQRMMMSPDCLNQVELADINSKLSSFSIKSSNFEISPMKNMDHDFRNGVRIVNKISMEQEHDSSRNEETDAPFNLLTEFKAPVMSTALSILQISIRRRQDRFQAAGVCEALVEILKINYQESMLLSGDVAYKEIATREENAERSAGSSFFKSTVSSVSSFFSKRDPSAVFEALDIDAGRAPKSPSLQLASPRYRKSYSNGGAGNKKTFQFRSLANDLLENICEAIRLLVKNDILSRLEFFRIGLYSVLYKIRQDDCQPESDLDCVGSLQSWLNQHLVDSLISGSPSSEETVLCIHHALQLCVGESKILQCFVLLEDSYNENLVTESLVLIKTLRAIGNVISRPDKDEIVSVLFNRDSSARYSCLSMIINIAVEYNSDLEVISQWCSVMSILASSSGQLKALLGSNGACTSAVGLLDSHKTRPSLVQDVLWCLCSLSANNRNNLMQILAWKGGTEASRVNINSLLQALYKSRSQTNETREHAELLIGWLDIAASSLENVEHQSTSPALLTQLRIKDESIFRYANRNSRNELMLHKAEARFYPLVSKETPQMIVWDTGEQGTLCFDGEVYGFGANAAEEVFWGTVEV